MKLSQAVAWHAGVAVVAGLLIFPVVSRAGDGGEALFKGKCAGCHGADGKGETAMGKTLKLRDLASADVQKQSDADLNGVITKGKNKMPAFEAKLKAEEITQLVAYIRGLGKKH